MIEARVVVKSHIWIALPGSGFSLQRDHKYGLSEKRQFSVTRQVIEELLKKHQTNKSECLRIHSRTSQRP